MFDYMIFEFKVFSFMFECNFFLGKPLSLLVSLMGDFEAIIYLHCSDSKSINISHAVSNFFGTEFEIWASFVLSGSH